MKNKGMCWCVHHDQLLEYWSDYTGRVDFIKENKPRDEIPTRLREMQFVKGKLPEELIEACTAYDKARAALDKAYTAYVKAYTAYTAFVKVYTAYDKARAARVKALETHRPTIEKLHAEECPDSCWDGSVLVFPKGQK